MIPFASPKSRRRSNKAAHVALAALVFLTSTVINVSTGHAGAKKDDAYRPPEGSGSTLHVPGSAPATAVLHDSLGPAVESSELAPVMAGDGSALPYELWRGVDIPGFEKLISEIEIPPRSPALHDLWKRLITSNVTPPAGQTGDVKFTALRLEALYRSGLVSEAAAELANASPDDPVVALFAARNALANADRNKACALSQHVVGLKADTPKVVIAQAALLNGYCAAVSGDTAGAGLAAELAREAGLQQTPGLAALDAISIGVKPAAKIEGRLGLIDYRLLEAAGAPPPASDLDKAEPALLVALTNDSASPPDLRLAAAEAGAKLNGVSPDALAAIYSALSTPQHVESLLSGSGGLAGAPRRAALFKAAEAERTPMKKTRLIRALVDDARANGLAFPVMMMLARTTAQVPVQPELSWFTETAAEIGLVSANYKMTYDWVALSQAASPDGSGYTHWLALADIAGANIEPQGQHLAELEVLAQHSRFSPDALNRLATVLDALQYMVPIPLWEIASRSPQPTTGYLPETGVLSELRDAAKKKEFGHTVLLAMKALGPSGAEGANMIALGDSIRALKRAGLEPDARRLGFEALFASWPRTAIN
ncbi:MAG: hypothetical protein KDJ17_02670 [Hyphomicrobiaceae bacterium]|nr:hypothetical protein [Hyphomicrobiaceae bacterium]